jgi:hypothetical protein
MARDTASQVYVEFIPVGDYVKVSAIDPKSGTEVSIVGDPKQGNETLKRTAVRKLFYVLNKKANDV